MQFKIYVYILNKIIFQYDYVYDHEKNKSKNRFDVTDTPVYSQIRDHDKQTNDVSIILFTLK